MNCNNFLLKNFYTVNLGYEAEQQAPFVLIPIMRFYKNFFICDKEHLNIKFEGYESIEEFHTKNKIELKLFADKYLKPLPPPPLKDIGKGTNLSIAIEFITISMINKIKNNNRVIGIIFTDDESHLIKEDNIFF